MIPYLPCETARELLEPFVDRELSTAEQVAVETHLRSCRTCSARVGDLSLIGWSVRTGTPVTHVASEDVRALGVMQSGVLARIKAEQAQSWRVRMREQLSDMRLWWPAMGATAAVLACLFGSVSIWSLATQKPTSSLAWALDIGSDSNPRPLDDDISMPRVLDAGPSPERISTDDGVYILNLFVTRTGQVGWAELLPSRRQVRSASAATARAAEDRAVIDAVMGSRFAPAQAANGRAVAVRVVMVIERTTIREKLLPIEEAPVQQARRSKPVSQPLPGARSALQQSSARA